MVSAPPRAAPPPSTPQAAAAARASGAATPPAATLLLRLLASVQARRRGADAAMALATEIAVGFACDRVSIGLQERQGMRLVALSHQPLAKENAALLQSITAAMDEAALQRTTLSFPAGTGADRHILLAHEALSARQLNGRVVTVPLASQGQVRGALTLERPMSRPFSKQECQFFEHVAALIGPVLDLKFASEAPLWRLLGRRLRARLDDLPLRSTRARVLLGCGVALLIGIACVPIQYRVGASAHLEGHMQRALAAPADGFIKAAHVRPGDEVISGQVLAELNDEEFRLERDRRQSELVQLQSALGDALGKHDYAQIGVLSAKVQEARADLDLAGQQLQRTRLEAPFDGVVIKGDLTQSIGTPVRQGDTLFVLTPAGDHRVILDVDEKSIGDVEIGQRGRLTLSAYPAQPIPITVKRITPMAVAKEGRNYFEVEAAPGEATGRLRPGLQGVAKIDVDQRPLLAVLLKDTWQWLRLQAWRAIG